MDPSELWQNVLDFISSALDPEKNLDRLGVQETVPQTYRVPDPMNPMITGRGVVYSDSQPPSIPMFFRGLPNYDKVGPKPPTDITNNLENEFNFYREKFFNSRNRRSEF